MFLFEGKKVCAPDHAFTIDDAQMLYRTGVAILLLNSNTVRSDCKEQFECMQFFRDVPVSTLAPEVILPVIQKLPLTVRKCRVFNSF